MSDVLHRIDAFCDAVPRAWTSVIDDGPLRLFVRDGPGWPFYARPVPGGGRVTVADVRRMRARQRASGLPETFEWVDAVAPTMRDAVRESGLLVRACPVLVLDELIDAPPPRGYHLRLVGPVDGDLADAEHQVRAVASAAFGGPPPGRPTATGLDGLRTDLAAGRVARVLVNGPDGRPVASGAAQRSGDVVELVGIATARAARGRGLGAAVTAALARAARGVGAGLVFLAASDAAASRVYERVGFRRVGDCGIVDSA